MAHTATDLTARHGAEELKPRLVGDEQISITSAFDPVSLSAAKTYLEVSHSQDDTLIKDLISTAEGIFEDGTSHFLQEQTRRVTFDKVSERYRIPAKPVSSLDTVETVDEGAITTETVADWYLHPVEPKEIRLGSDGTDLADDYQMIRFEYTAGYSSQGDVPQKVKIVLKKMVSDLYEYRTSKGEGLNRQLTEQPMQWADMLRPLEAAYYGQPKQVT